MSGAHPEVLAGLLAALTVAWLVVRATLRSETEARAVGSAAGGGSRSRSRILRALLGPLGLALAFLAAALAEAGSAADGTEPPETLIVLDASKSMLARDVEPCRLERARAELEAALPDLAGQRLGLIAAAGRRRVACPVTADHGAFRDFLDRVDPDLEERGGSSVLTAVGAALERFTEVDSPAPRSILVLSDGEWQDAEKLAEVASEARRRGVVVLTVCYGSPEGAQLFTRDAGGLTQPRRDSRGEPIWSRAHPENLQALAEATAGQPLQSVAEILSLDRFATAPPAGRRSGVQWLLVLALLSWVGEMWWKGLR